MNPSRYTAALPLLLALVALPIRAAGSDTAIQFSGQMDELVVSQISEHTIRFQLSPLEEHGAPQIPPVSPMLVPVDAVEKLRVRDLAGPTNLVVAGMRVSIEAAPLAISIRRADGSLVQELDFDDATNAMAFRTDGSVLGLGEGADQFDRRGANYPLINGQRDRLAVLGTRIFSPFVIGTGGWAMFVAAPDGSFDLRGSNGVFHARRAGMQGGADVFVIDARDPADALREFIRLTGAPVMPPKWALGYMQSHRTLSSEADILAEAREFREKNLPCDTFIFLGTGFCPAGWNLGHDSFQFNTNVFSDAPAQVLDELHADHLHVILHVVPLQKDYPALHGGIPLAQGEELDATDIGSYWKRHEELFTAGVDGWWPDEGDWYDVPSRLARHRMYYEGPAQRPAKCAPMGFAAERLPGIARYGGWVWSGDISSSWKTLAAQVEVGQNSSLSVSPYWGTDTGGFYPSADREYTGELYARWFEFSTFCPSFRSHGRTWHLHLPWGWDTGETGPVESRPAPDPSELHNADVEPICRKYLELRYALLPYNYTLAREASDTGLPFMRALWLSYPTDAVAAGLGSEYLWGRDLLIAPVVEKGATSRRVYLPAGSWYDWWTGGQVAGGNWIDRPVDLGTLPIYVRAGAIIPLDPVRQYTGQSVTGPTTIHVYPGADGDYTLYDDDGESLGYRDGTDTRTVWIRFRWNDASRRLSIEPDPRMKQWPGGSRSFAVDIAGSGAKPVSVEFRGAPVEIKL